MIRLTLLLCAGLFSAMFIGGRDNGQLRFGLMPQAAAPSVAVATMIEAAPVAVIAPRVAVAAVPSAPEDDPAQDNLITASFAPQKPLMVAPVAEPAAQVAPAPVANTEGLILRVNVRSLNVRAGPSTDYSVMGRLRQGDEVLVVAQGDGPDGWSMIRIEGDGVEGYVASRLLSE